jgi:4-hydroxy-tetrahydrodipicolinate synthase
LSLAEPLFSGVGVALVTLFDDVGQLDTDATAAHARRMVDAGVGAVLVAGTTGEPWMLTELEQAELVEAVLGAVNGAVPVLAGVRGDDALERAIHAASAGVDAILALSPPEHPAGYYEDVAAVGPPVLAYHFPAVSPPGLPVDLLPTLPVEGIKDSSGSDERLRREIAIWDKPVYTGASALVQTAARMGAAGAILGVANVEPERAIAAWSGDQDAQDGLESLQLSVLKERMAERFGTSPTLRA